MDESEKKEEAKGGYSTQRVDLGTVTLIKTINLHLIRRGIKMRQSDLINAAFRFVKSREWEFIEYVETKKQEDEGIRSTISRVISKPWLPYGNFSS
jgi:hypothetical protein